MDRTKLIPFNLEAADKRTIVQMDKVAESFIGTLRRMHGKSESEAEMIYEREAMYLKKAITDSDRLAQCSGISIYSAFLEIAINNLSIQGGQKSEAYIESRSSKVGNGWVNTATLAITAYGELNMRIRAGQIIRANNPQVIYEGDHFQPKTNERGDLVVDFQPAIPRKSNKIVGCYVCLVLPNDGRDFKWLLAEDIARLQNYSTNRGKTSGNALYTVNGGAIDPGFLEAKTLKHAFRAYGKLRVSDNVKMESDVSDEFEQEMNEQSFQPAQEHAGPQAGVNAAPVTVTVDDDDDIF